MTHEVYPTPKEDLDTLDTAHEVAVEKPPVRVVVFGSRMRGALSLSTDFEGYLQSIGFADAQVQGVRDIAMIGHAFYDIDPRAEPTSADYRAVDGITGRLMQQEVATVDDEVSVPNGVIVMPEMRRYDAYNGSGMTISTPHDYISELCKRHDVPLIFLNGTESPDDLRSAITGAFSGPVEH